MCIYFPFLWRCCRNRYNQDHDIVSLPELRTDQRKVEIVSPTQNQPNNDKTQGYRPFNTPGTEDQICEATPLVQNQSLKKPKKVSLETDAMPTLMTYVTNGTNISLQEPATHQSTNDSASNKDVIITSSRPDASPSLQGNTTTIFSTKIDHNYTIL